METVTLLYEDYQKELAEDFKNTFLKRASDTDSSRSNDAVIDEVTDMLSTNIAVYTEKLLRQWGFSSGGEGGSGGGDVTITLDDLLQKYLEDNYVTIKGDQEVYGEKDFRKGIRIAGRRLYWDESNDALVIEGAAYTTRWLSAYGMSPGGGGGAGSGGAAAMYQLIDVSPNDTKDAVLGAEKDYVLTFDGNFWRGMPNKGGLSSKLFTALDKDGNEVNPDDENSEIYAIRANYSLWSVDWISAKGKSSGGSGGGGGLISLVYGFESLGGTFDNNDNTATFNAFTINEIWKLASSGLTNVTVTGSGNAVTDVTKGSDGRSLTFTKGNMFASKSEFDALNTKFNAFLTGSDADDIINKWSELEVFLQGMKESDNLAVILQSKMDKSVFNKLFSALDSDGNEIDPSDDTKTVAAIRANFGFWGVDYVSAKGVSKGSGGTGGASALYQLVDVLANDTGDGVDGAVAGKALVFDGTHWKAADAGLNESQLSAFLSLNGYLTQTAADGRYVTSARKVIAGTGLSGGGSLTSNVTLSLGTSGVVAGTYTKVMVDVYGRVTSGTSLSATDIPSLDWSKITTGKPTTLAGYGITDAYSKTEADGKYVTIATAQTISGAKTFSAVTKTASVLPSADANSKLGGTANRWNNIYSVNGTFSQNVTAKLLSASETLQIGDAYLKWDSTNNAVYVIKKDGTTPVGFYSTDWLSAKGVSMSDVQTGTLTDLIDVEITNPTNGQALKYDAISQKWVNGTIDSFNVNQMWTELTKADSSKVIDASHIPTSVLDNRWVKKAGDTMTGTLTSASTSGAIVFKGVKNCDITNIYKDNGVIKNDDGGLTSIRNGLRFNWYDTYWYIGNLRGSSTDSAGFGVVDHNNKLVLRVTPNDVRAPRFMSTVATGLSPLIVSSNTLVNNLNADLLDGYHQSKFLRTDGVNQHVTLTGGSGNTEGYRLVLEATVSGGWSVSSMTLLVNSRHSGTGIISLVFHTTNKESTSYVGSLNYYGSTTQYGGITTWRLFYNTTTKKIRLFWRYYDYNDCHVSILNRRGVTTNISDGTWYTTLPSDNGNELPSYYNRSDTTGSLATSRTLWGQPFNGTANVSGDMTGVGSITMSGDLKIGNGTSPNTIYFYGTTGDLPGGNHTFIAERIWGGTQCSELVLFKGNDIGNGTDAITVSNSGPDRIRHIAAAHLFQTYTTELSGSVESVCTSSALKNLFSIASNRVISYVQLQSTIASGVAPFIVASNTVVSNLNADLLDGQHLSDLDGRYVNVTGDTMTGDLTMNNTKGFNMGSGTRVVKTSGNWIHGGGDTASSTDANLRFASWCGIGWYPTIDTASGVRQGNNAMWLNVRTGVLNVAGGIKESNICIGRVDSKGNYNINCAGEISRYDHHLYLQRNSGKNLIMCTGGGLAGIGTDSPRAKLDVAGNVYSTGFFYSTVGTGTAPYQCSSTTLNTNLNADLLDNWHIMDIPRNYNSTATYSLQFALGGTDNGWKKIFACSESGTGPWRSVTVWGQIWYAYANHAQEEVRYYHFCAIFQMRKGPSASDSNVGNISNSARLYLPTFAKGMDNIRLVRVGTNNFELQVRQIGSNHNGHIQYQYWANGANVSAWRGLQSTSNTSVAVSAGGASTLADSRASSADVWTSARTFYIQDHNAAHTGTGISVNGSANVYLKLPNSIQCGDWFRSTGNSGWYHQDYGGGIYMQDSTWVRVYGKKRFYVGNAENSDFSTATAISTEGGIYARKNITSSANIIANGAITAKASSSDIRLKTDIQGYDAMGIIRKFRSVKYHWNNLAKRNSEIFNHKKWNYGLIAQDLLSGGYSQWVSDIFKDYYTIDYERLIPVVWKGLQEVDDEVTKLRKEVVRLNKRISELEKFLCA